MTNTSTPSSIALMPGLEAAWQDVAISFDRFCLVAGIGAMEQVLREDAQRLTGPRHGRGGGRVGHRWGMTKGKIGFHGGNVAVQRPRRVCRNVKRWRNAGMALRWTAAGMLEAAKGFRSLKAHKHLPALRAALIAHQAKLATRNKLEENLQAA